MSLVVYNEDNLLDFKNKFDNNSIEISNSLSNICREINTIDVILSTPKTNKIVPLIVDYYNRQIKYMNDTINSFDSDFNTIINEYKEFASDIKKMVGDDYDK